MGKKWRSPTFICASCFHVMTELNEEILDFLNYDIFTCKKLLEDPCLFEISVDYVALQSPWSLSQGEA